MLLYWKTVLCVTSLCLINASNCEAQSNALDFDGSNDFTSTYYASKYVKGYPRMSLSFWVYPTSANPSKPYGQGFVGFSSNANIGEFHIRQLHSDSVRGRFRNSSGTKFDIEVSGLTLNNWQHFALVFDSVNLIMYRNGIQIGIKAASGIINDTIHSFFTGALPVGLNNSFFDGKIDEATLWNKALTPAEVTCLYKYGVDSSMAGLKLYYNFNQGIAAGNNIGINYLLDAMGNSNAPLSGFTWTGNSSNFVSGVPTYTYDTANICKGDSLYYNGTYISLDSSYWSRISITSVCDSFVQLKLFVHNHDSLQFNQTICKGDSLYFFGTYWTESGFYSMTVNNQFGCDSLVELSLTVDSVDTGVIQNGDSLTSSAVSVNYQWYRCDLDSVLTGSTDSFYVIADEGSYAVIVSNSNCTDTSQCFLGPGMIDINTAVDGIVIFPNPAHDLIHIDGIKEKTSLQIFDNTMKLSREFMLEEDGEVDLSGLQEGQYYFRFQSRRGTSMRKVLILP